MAVNTSHRKEPTEMNVITKAKDVFKHSRLMIKDIYELSKEIVTKLIAANDYMLNDEEQRSLRLRYQLEAVTACKNLLFLVEQAYEESYISSGSCVYWTQLISDVKNMTLAWHKKDKQR